MICRDQVFDFYRKYNPVHPLGFYSTPGSCCFRLLTDSTIEVFRMIGEHSVVSSWLGTDDSFLYSWYILPEYLSPRR